MLEHIEDMKRCISLIEHYQKNKANLKVDIMEEAIGALSVQFIRSCLFLKQYSEKGFFGMYKSKDSINYK